MLKAALPALAASFLLAGAGAEKPKKPHLSLQIRPSAVYPEQSIVASAQLTGIEGNEDYLCPQVEWTWGDGSDGLVEGNQCASPEPSPPPARAFSADHAFHDPGMYVVEISIRPKTGNALKASMKVRVSQDKGPGMHYYNGPSPHPCPPGTTGPTCQ
jgi:hypothetical protein